MEGFEKTLCINIVLLLSSAWSGDATDYDQVIGNSVHNRNYLDNPIIKNCIWMPDPTSYATIDHASVTKWEFYTRKAGTVVLQIWRPGASRGQFTLIGSSPVTVHRAGFHVLRPKARSIYPVMRGDVIAVYMPRESIIPFSAKYSRSHCRDSWYMRTNGNVFLRNARTQSVNFMSRRQKWGPCRKYSVRAFLQEVRPETTTQQTETSTSSPNTKLPPTQVSNVTTSTESWSEPTEISSTTQTSTTKTIKQCCFDVYPGEALIGRVIAVVASGPIDCASHCCNLDDCRSFSATESEKRPFCVLFMSSRDDDDSIEIKKNTQFDHQEKRQCI